MVESSMKNIGFLSFGHWSPSPQLADPLGVRRAAAVHRPRRRGRGARRRRRLLPRAPLRPAAGLAVPAARRRRRPHQQDRDRHRRHRHALREPAVHGRGRRRRRPDRGRPAAARHQPRLTGAGRSTASATSATCRRTGPTTPTWRASTRAVFLELLEGEGFAEPNPRPMFPNPPGLLRLEPHSPGLRDRIWWGAGTRADRRVDRRAGHEPDELDPAHRGHRRPVPPAAGRADPDVPRRLDGRRATSATPRVSVSRSIFPIVSDLDRAYFGREPAARTRSATSTAASPASARPTPASRTSSSRTSPRTRPIAAADTLLLTVPNQLGVDYNAHVLDSVVRHVAPELGWR